MQYVEVTETPLWGGEGEEEKRKRKNSIYPKQYKPILMGTNSNW